MGRPADVQRVPGKDLEFLRAHARQWLGGQRKSWVAYNRATGLGVIIAALGCVYGLTQRGWTPLDAALLLYADMLAALLADALRFGFGRASVQRALKASAEEDHCWSLLLDLRFRGVIEPTDVRRARSRQAPVVVSRETWSPIEGADPKSGSLGCLYFLSIAIIILFGLGLWFFGIGEAAPEQSLAYSDPAFLLWLALAALWRLGDSAYLIHASQKDSGRLDLLPAAGIGPGLVLIVLPVIGLAAFLALPDKADAFWLAVVVAYIFSSLFMGALMVLFAWLRECWLAAFVLVDQEGRVGSLDEVLVFSSQGSPDSDPLPLDQAPDEPARKAYELMLERPDWVNGAIRPEARVRKIFWVAGSAGAWTLAAVGLVLSLLWPSPATWIGLASVSLAAMILTGRLWPVHVQQQRFGQPVLLLDRTPLRLGQPMGARLEVSIPPGTGPAVFKCQLACKRTRHVSGSGSGARRRSSHEEETLWEANWEQVGELDANGRCTGARLIRDLPLDQPESKVLKELRFSEDVDWRLSVWMRCPGIDFLAVFAMPVFHPTTGIEIRPTRAG